MRRWFVLVVVAALGSPAGPAGAQPASKPAKTVTPPDVATALQNIAATYRAPEHEMWFTETYVAKASNRTLTAQGKLVFAKPAMLNLRYTNTSYVVVNGPTAGIFAAPMAQYSLQPSGPAYLAPFPFLAGPGPLAAQCNLTLNPGSQLQYPNGYVLVCDPRPPSPVFTKLLFYVDAASSEVRRVVVFDGNGDSDRFDLDQLQPHPAVSPQLFSLQPPPGAAVASARPPVCFLSLMLRP